MASGAPAPPSQPAAYAPGDHILFTADAPSTDRYILGRIHKVFHEPTRYSRHSSGTTGGHSGRNSGRDGSSTGGAQGVAYYEVAPQLVCHTIASKKTPGKQLARAVRYDASALPPQGGESAEAVLHRSDIDELNERRLQLQMDVDTSKARVAEIDLYIESLALNQAEDRQRSAEAAVVADKEVLQAKAALRACNANDWRRLLQQANSKDTDSSRVLTAVVEAALALVGVGAPSDVSEKEFEKKVMALRASTVHEKHRRGLKKAETCLKDFPARSVPSEHVLLSGLYKWLQAVVKTAHAHVATEEADAAMAELLSSDGRADDSRAKQRQGSARAPSPTPTKPTRSRSAERDAEVSKLRTEQAEHQEYLDIALEELEAIDELIQESKAALAALQAPSVLRVPPSQIAGGVTPSGELQAILKAAAAPSPPSSAPEPVKLTLKVGTELAGLMTRHRQVTGIAARRYPSASPGAVAGGPSSSSLTSSAVNTPRDPPSQAYTRPNSARNELEQTSPTVPTLPLKEFKQGATADVNSARHVNRSRSRDGDGRSSVEREDMLEGSLRDRFEKINSAPRLPTPRVGPPLLEEQSPLLHRLSGSGLQGVPGAGAASSSVPDDAVVQPGSPALTNILAQERLLHQQKVSELERKLERALQANPKEAELQLLRDELKGTKSDLHRVTEERDALVKERREKSQFSMQTRRPMMRNLSQATGPGEAAPAPSDSLEDDATTQRQHTDDSGRFGDQAIIEELEEQLNAAHRRIRELESNYRNQSGATGAAAAAARQSVDYNNYNGSSGGPLGGVMSSASSPPPPPLGFSAEQQQATFSQPLPGQGKGDAVNRSHDGGGDSPLTLSPSTGASGLPSQTKLHRQRRTDGHEELDGSHSRDGSGVQSPSPSPELTAAQQQVQVVLAQLAQEQQMRQQLQAKMETILREYEGSKKNSKDLEERLNLALHAREQSQAQADQQRKELDVMWTRLEEAEAQLQEHQERESMARLQQEFMAEESVTAGRPGMPSQRGAHSMQNNSYAEPSMHLPSILQNNLEAPSELPSASYSVTNVNGKPVVTANPLRMPTLSHNINHTDMLLSADDPDLSRASSPAFVHPRDASLSPQPNAMMGVSGVSPARAVSTQPVEHMSAVELRHEVRLLRDAVEALQSSELRLATELGGLRDKQKEERRRRQQARTVRLQMLNRLQEAVQQAMETGADMATVPDVLARTQEEADAILAHRRMGR